MSKFSKKQKIELLRIVLCMILLVFFTLLEHIDYSDYPGNAGYEIWFDGQNMMDDFWLLWLIPYCVVGNDVIIDCFKGIKNGNFLDEKFLMVIATVGAFVCGEFAEGVAVMIFYQLGEFFQGYAVGKSRNAISDLMNISPDFANRLKNDGSIEQIDLEDIFVDDILIIKPGEKVPVDGIVIEGEGILNTSALTGESIPLVVNVGKEIISGCVNGDNLIKIKATKTYENSTVSQILELVEDAQAKKSNTERFITRFARIYTPIVVSLAVLLAVVPSLIWGSWNVWLLRACTFLVISCPCALVISVPMAFFGGIGLASKQGVLVKGANYLEMMSKLSFVVSDKTGTLTEGNFQVVNVNTIFDIEKNELLKFAVSLEKNITHPIAKSITDYCGDIKAESLVSDIKNFPGKGVSGFVGYSEILVGTFAFFKEREIVIPKKYLVKNNTVVYVSKDNKFIGSIELSDRPKEGIKNSLLNIKNEGIEKIIMLTGDTEESASFVSKELGIDEYKAELLPQDKVFAVEELIEQLKGTKKYLAYIGDGVNDAPVLARADIGISMGALGSDAAIEASDIVIMDDNLGKIQNLIKIAKKTLSTSKANIIFALFIKVLCLILGAIGIANMWIAVFADVGVAMICILNSMRMLVKKEN